MTGTKRLPPGRRTTTRQYGTKRADDIFPSNIHHRPALTSLPCRNKKAPMPQLVMTSPMTGTGSSVVPPASAFQSPIRILKRSAAQTGKYASDDSSAFANTTGTGTFAERSARYNAARERIFAGTTEANGGRGESGPIPAIIRNPKGPEDARGTNGQGKEGSQGFGTRARVRGSSNNRPVENQDRQFQDSDLGTK